MQVISRVAETYTLTYGRPMDHGRNTCMPNDELPLCSYFVNTVLQYIDARQRLLGGVHQFNET